MCISNNIKDTKVPAIIPHIKPDQVLFGDIDLDNFFPPMYLPQKYEKLSVVHTKLKKASNKNNPSLKNLIL